MKNAIRAALLADLDQLMPLLRGYYQDDGLEFDPARAAAAMGRLLREPQWGRVLILQSAQPILKGPQLLLRLLVFRDV